MDFEKFADIVDACKKEKPILFELEHDKIIDEDEVRLFESENHIKLPEKYIRFLCTYGGGYFGYVNIYSLDKNSSFYVLNYNEIPFGQYLNIADNGCGDYYMMCIDDGVCLDSIFRYDHETKNITETKYSDILEYLIQAGLKYTD